MTDPSFSINLFPYTMEIQSDIQTESLSSLSYTCNYSYCSNQYFNSILLGYQVDADYEEEFQDKRSELGEVFEKTQQLLEAKMISPAELMSYLGYSFPELKPGLSSCGTIPEVLDLVRSHTSLVNISILKALVKKFGLTGKEDFINNFKKSIDDFCEKMKMQHAYGQRFAESFSQCPLKSETITFVLDWDANEKYLKDLTGLFKKVFKKYSSDLKIQVIHEGNSIVVECYIPSHRQGVFARLVQESEKALTEEEVISVTIGGFVVFKQNSSKVHYVCAQYCLVLFRVV